MQERPRPAGRRSDTNEIPIIDGTVDQTTELPAVGQLPPVPGRRLSRSDQVTGGTALFLGGALVALVMHPLGQALLQHMGQQ